MKFKGILICSLAVLIGVLLSLTAGAADNETLYFNDFSTDDALSGLTVTEDARADISLANSESGESVLKVETVAGTVNSLYSYVQFPQITHTTGEKPDVAFEIRMKNSMNGNGFITTRADTHSFLISGTNFKAGLYAPDNALGNLATVPYNSFNTVTVTYDAEETFRKLYLNGKHISDSGSGTDPSYGMPTNRWSAKGILDIRLWFYLQSTGHFSEIDYVKVYRLCESLEGELLYKDASDTQKLYIDFNSPVNISSDMLSVEGAEIDSCNLYDNEKNIYEITLKQPLETEKSYTLKVNGVTEIRGKTFSSELSFRTRGEVVYKPIEFVQGGVTGAIEFNNSPVSARLTVKNPYEEKKTFTLYLAGYSVDDAGRKALASGAIKSFDLESGEIREISSDEMKIHKETDALYAYVWCGLEPVTSAVMAKTKEYIEPDGAFPAFDGTEIIGDVAFARKTVRTATGLTASGYRTYITFAGTPAYIYEFDTITGKYINKFPAGTGQHLSLCVGSDGMLYHIPYGEYAVYQYNPETRVNKAVARFSVPSGGPVWGMTPGGDNDNSVLYAMVHNYNYKTAGHTLIEFDVETQTVKTYGGIDVGCGYAHGATGNDKYLFASSGDTLGTEKITRIDRETGEQLVWKNDTEYAIGNVGTIRVSQDTVFIFLGHRLIAVDIETMKTKHDYKPYAASGCIAVAKPIDTDGRVYTLYPGKKYSTYYNPTSGGYYSYQPFPNPIEGIGYTGFGEWVRDGYVWKIAAVGSNDCKYRISLISPGANKIKTVIPDFPDDDYGLVTSPERFYVSEDDILYVGGYESGLSAFDLKTNKPLYYVDNEIQHAMTMVDGKLFGGTYAAGNIYMLDTEKAVDYSPANRYSGNPKIVKNGVTGVMRHYNSADTNAGFGLISGVADYGGTEGGVFLCSYINDSPQVKYYGGVIPGENITGLAYRDGYIYVSSTVTVNLQTPHEEAHIARVDARTGETVLMVSLDIPEAGEKFKKIGGLAFGPDGLLYGIGDSGGTVFALNPEDLSLLRYKCLYPGLAPTGGVASPGLVFGSEGNIYAIVNSALHMINPETLENEILWGKATMFGIDNDGNILKKSGASSAGSSVELIKVNPRERLELMIKNAEKYYKAEDYSKETFESFEKALSDAKKINIGVAHTDKIKETARRLTMAIRNLNTIYDENAGYG